ncbi:4Fe-4S dicluster domain-containing protein [Dehalococcoidia bacterium]|nr:4Fe-4S dicluster domain-containing protein [Dehalococcoidia bacterium]
MIGIFKGLAVTIATVFRKPVTVQYPDGDPPAKLLGQKPKSRVHLPLSSRYMGFPVLLWDDGVDEPACTGCMVCMRYCPTECMTVTMKDNPLFAEGKSKRKKIVDNFEIRMERCILCAICVEVCNFEAIAMSDYHEEADLSRGGLIASKTDLFRMGRDYQDRAGIVVGGADGEEEDEE